MRVGGWGVGGGERGVIWEVLGVGDILLSSVGSICTLCVRWGVQELPNLEAQPARKSWEWQFLSL